MRNFTVILLIFSVTGCSLTAPSLQTITIQASSSSAEVAVDGRVVGVGTAVVELQRDRTHSIVARTEGKIGVATVGTRISQTGIMDVIGGVLFLFPFLGVTSPGFWSLDRDFVYVVIPGVAADQTGQPTPTAYTQSEPGNLDHTANTRILNGKEKNQLWWVASQSSESEYARIAADYGVSEHYLRRVLDEGQRADWRSKTAPR